MSSFLDREHSIAGPDYNRWLVPPAALAIHLCIGQVYGFSVFKLPLTQLVGLTKPLKGVDWTQTQLAWIFSIAIFILGASAAVFGKWMERNGPRKAMFVAACCFCGGFLVAALGVELHNLWVVYLGYGVLGGVGLGIGYISPVSTLVKWFPDRPGMATGLAIMGFGGGAMIGSPLATDLMKYFATPTSLGGLGFPPSTIGYCLAVVGLTNGIFQALFFTRLHRKCGSRRLYIWSVSVAVPIFLLFPVMSLLARNRGVDWTVWMALCLQFALTIPLNMCFGCIFIFITAAASSKQTLGGTNGLAQMFVSIMRCVAPAVVTSLFSVSLSLEFDRGKGIFAGSLVYLVMLVFGGIAIAGGTMLPKVVWTRPEEN